MQYDIPEYLKRRVQISNIIALLLLFTVAIPFVGISLIYLNPSMAMIPGITALSAVFVLIMNQYGQIYISRITASVVPILTAVSYNAFLSNSGDEPIGAVYLFELSFALIPFLIFDLKEKTTLIFIGAFCFLVIVSFPITKEWVSSDADATVLREGWLVPVTSTMSVFTAFACLITMSLIGVRAEKKNKKLLTDMNDRNESLEKAHEKSIINLKKIEISQEEEQQRNWAAEGISDISKILRSNKDSKEIFDSLTSAIIKYIEANQGGLYIVEKDEEENENILIKLASCYAFSRKKYQEQEYAPGQGLLGQVYLEEEYLLLTYIPQEYITITSGLGDANPKSLIIIPLIINDEVEGLLEIASFKKFEEHHIDFLHKVGENIASYIQTNRINQRTSTLLQSAQMQAEELKAQEEEMKQNMEELSATQEEMQRKEKEYHKVIEDLKSELSKFKETV